jgi:uncharacterized membrane protein YkvA (DUF1232 family)
MSRDSFVLLVREALLTMPQILKAILRMVEDSEMPDQGRKLAAGALVHWLSATKTIPGVAGILGYVDDVLLIGLVLSKVESLAPEITGRYLADLPEPFVPLTKAVDVIRDYLGPVAAVLEKAVGEVTKLKHKGRTVEQYIHDDQATNRLYQDVQSALIELDMEESEINAALKGIDSIFESLKRRVQV